MQKYRKPCKKCGLEFEKPYKLCKKLVILGEKSAGKPINIFEKKAINFFYSLGYILNVI